jgi:prepilin-type N-terminal cleavage/methylation domain-containing protein
VRGVVEGSRGQSQGGFTLLELCITIVIIGILATVLIAALSVMRERSQRVQCMSNLRNLYAGAELFVQQNGSWPQVSMPDDESDSADQQYAKAWIDALAPFGPTQKTWVCPTMQEFLKNPDLTKPENVRIDYLATAFDDKPTTPHEWPRQPWFGEVGNMHGNGNLIIFTDGSISDLKTLMPSPSPKK